MASAASNTDQNVKRLVAIFSTSVQMSVITAVDHIIAKLRHIHNSDLISSTHIMTINKFFLNLFEVEIEHPEN